MVNPYEKSCYFFKLFCLHSSSTKDAKVDQGVHLFCSFRTNIVSKLKKLKKSMLQNIIYKLSIYYVKCINNDFLKKLDIA